MVNVYPKGIKAYINQTRERERWNSITFYKKAFRRKNENDPVGILTATANDPIEEALISLTLSKVLFCSWRQQLLLLKF